MNDVVGAATFELRANKDRFIQDALRAERDLKESVKRIEKQYGVSSSQARRAYNRAQRQMVQDTQRAEKDIRRSADGISGALRNAAAAIAAGFTAREIVRYADQYTTLQNRLKTVGLEGDELARVQDRLYQAGNRNGVAVADLAQLYSRAALSAGMLGASQSQLLQLTDGVTAALRVQGVSAQEASGPLMQLGQALGAGTVRAEEINSILEGVPVLAQAAARGLGIVGGSVAELRRRVAEGEVSSQAFFQALLKGLPAVEEQAERSALTIGQAMTVLNNQLGRFVGETDQSLSASQRLSQGIISLANNLDDLIPVVTILVTFFGVRYVAGLTAATIATARASVATNGLRASLLGLAGGPVGIAITAIAALAAGIAYLIQQNSDAAIAARAQADAERRAIPAKTDLERLTRELATASRDRARAIREEIAALIELQRVEAARLTEDYNQAKARARVTDSARPGSIAQSVMRPQEALMYEGIDIGAAPDTGDVRRARAALQAQVAIVSSMEDAYRQATEESRALNNSTAEGDKGEAKRAQARARMLEDLELQTRLEEASQAQRLAIVREVEREAEIVARIRSLRDAGFSAERAAAVSAEIQNRLDEAREQGRIRLLDLAHEEHQLTVAQIDQDHEIIRAKERQAELQQLIATFAEVTTSEGEALASATSAQAELDAARERATSRVLANMQAQHRITVAELSGNNRLLRQLEDQEEIRTRSLEYQSEGRMSPTDANARARSEVTRERQAATYGEQRELFATAFSDGIRAAMSGDLKNFLSNQFGNFADIAFKRMGEQLYDSIFGGVSAVAEGTAEGTAHAAIVGPAIVSAGAGAGAAMSAAIISAGAAAGAAMATAISSASSVSGGAGSAGNAVLALFGGGRQFGGSVSGGKAYRVGEAGAETFVPASDGYIVPNGGMSSQGGMQRQGVDVRLFMDGDWNLKAMVDGRVVEIAAPMVANGGMMTARAVQSESARRQSQSFLRR